jgi:hypothetical protein
MDGNKLHVLDLRQEPGISSIAFTFGEVVTQWDENIEEIAMNSTCTLHFYPRRVMDQPTKGRLVHFRETECART